MSQVTVNSIESTIQLSVKKLTMGMSFQPRQTFIETLSVPNPKQKGDNWLISSQKVGEITITAQSGDNTVHGINRYVTVKGRRDRTGKTQRWGDTTSSTGRKEVKQAQRLYGINIIRRTPIESRTSP